MLGAAARGRLLPQLADSRQVARQTAGRHALRYRGIQSSARRFNIDEADKRRETSREELGVASGSKRKIEHADDAQSPQDETAGERHARATQGEVADSIAWHTSVVKQLREVLHRKRSDLEPRLKEQLASLGKRWNEYSGYEEVLEAKAQVLAAEVRLKELRDQQTVLRKDYMAAVSRRATSQRTLNELLVRKATWSEDDLAAYTDLLKSEHSDARAERDATERYEEVGNQVNAAWDNVVKTTLERYHLEQVWSDRVRAGSTYGSLIVAGINIVVFALALLVFEPYKRRKLAKTFETRLLQGEEQNTAMLMSVVEQLQLRIEDVQTHNGRAEAALELLLRQAGISRHALEEAGFPHSSDATPEGSSDASTGGATAPSQPSPPSASAPPRQQTINDRRREVGVAAAAGFALGAGLLAAFGALHS